VPRLSALNGEGAAQSRTIVLNKFEPITVVDVLVSSEAETPVRIVFKDNLGREGYFDIAMSKTNRSSAVAPEIGDFAKIMSVEDPKLTHAWPDDVWKAIESGKTFQGMTTEQVRLSLGNPI